MGATTEVKDPAAEAMAKAGVSATETVQADYFAFEETYRVPLPDGASWVEHKALNEGSKRQYLNSVNREVKFDRSSQNASINTAPGDERFTLLKAAICNWNLMRNGAVVTFNDSNLREFLDKANPKIVDVIEQDIRIKNPWLLNEMSVEDIDREIASLQKMREARVKEEEGKAA